MTTLFKPKRPARKIVGPGGAGTTCHSPEDVFECFAPRVYSLAYRMLGNSADAEDATQEVLLQVVRKLDSFRGESELMTWLHRVTVNVVLAHRRREARRPEQNLICSMDSIPAPALVNNDQPERKVLRAELLDHLEKAISELPYIYRDVFVLSDVEDLGNSEICRLLGLSLSAVKSRLHRARIMVRDAISPYLQVADLENPGRKKALVRRDRAS